MSNNTSNNTPFNPEHWFTFKVNHYLSTDTGKDLMGKVLNGMSEIQKQVQQHVDIHNDIMNSPTMTTGIRG